MYIHSRRLILIDNLELEQDLLNFPTIFDAVRARLGYTIRDMSNLLGISYQTSRRLCLEPGTPRLATIKSIKRVFPNINSARWRRWVYLIANRFAMDVSVELEELLSTGVIDIDAYSDMADSAALADSCEANQGRACSFYLHPNHIAAIGLLSSKLGKSQSQIIRDHIEAILSENKDVSQVISGESDISILSEDPEDIIKYD